jgi:hypothetical protein
MAKKEEVKRIYSEADGAMIETTDNIISFGTRDNAELDPEGVTEARLDALVLKRDEFMEMEDDEEWKGLVGEKVEEKNEAAELCETKMHNIRRMAANIYGDGSAKYRRFRFEGINNIAEDKRPKAYLRVWRRATGALADLAPEGLTVTVLAEFKAAIDDFDAKLDVVDDTVADRDEATEERIILGNEIWTEVSKIANTGKDYWFDKSEAKYNDYVLTEGGVTAPAGVERFNLAPNEVVVIAGPLVPGDPGSFYAKKLGPVGTVVALYYGLLPTQTYSGTGVLFTNNVARELDATEPGPIQTYLLAQNTSILPAQLDWALIEA